MSYSFGESFTSCIPDLDDPTHQIDRQIAALEDRPLALLLQPVAQGGAETGDQLVHAEGLRDVVVGAEIERLDLAGLVAAARQHHDRDGGAVLAQRRMSSCPLHVGQAEIQDDQIGRVGRDASSAPFASRRPRRPRSRGRRGPCAEAADRRLVVDDEDADWRARVMRLPARSRALRPATGRRDREDGARPVGAVAGRDRAAHAPRRSRGRWPARARSRPAAGRPCGRGRTCRRCARGPRAGCRALVQHLKHDASPSRQPCMRMVEPARRVFRGVVEQVESTCSNSTGSSASIGRSAARSTSTRCCGRILLGPLEALPTISPRSIERQVGLRARRIRAASCRAGWR